MLKSGRTLKLIDTKREKALARRARRAAGDGAVYRVAVEVQRRYWTPPDLSRSNGSSKWSR